MATCTCSIPFTYCAETWSVALPCTVLYPQEATQATELMYQWAPIDTADALELLSSSFLSEQVRPHSRVQGSGFGVQGSPAACPCYALVCIQVRAGEPAFLGAGCRARMGVSPHP